MWLLRDFVLKLESEGRPISSTQYLENVLKPLVNGDVEKIKARNLVRQSITNFFPNRVCFTLKRPVNDEKLLQKLESIKEEEIRPEFQEQSKELLKLIYREVEPKRLFGEYLNGRCN